MKPEIKKIFVEALRSDKYKQGKRRLKWDGDRDGAECKYCILGVLEDLFFKARKMVPPASATYRWYPDVQVFRWAGIKGNTTLKINGIEGKLSFHNDEGVDFKTLAMAIEEQL